MKGHGEHEILFIFMKSSCPNTILYILFNLSVPSSLGGESIINVITWHKYDCS